MQKLYSSLVAAVLVLNCCVVFGQELNINYLTTYSTGIFDEGAAEILAHEPRTQRVFFTNGNDSTIDVLDISDPSNPTLVSKIDISPYGDGINSVAVSNGLLAAAIENPVSTEPGSVVVFHTSGEFLNQFPTGVLPDMVTFSPNTIYILAANEGEPDDEYETDPEGSITIIDRRNGQVRQVDFTAYNDQKASLLNKGVRLFGPNATVAQDLEPEYITVAPDSKTAYVCLQENNAIAVVDIESATVTDILPLGLKDHLKGGIALEEYLFNEIPWWPALGTPAYGAPTVDLGGFSGLWFDPLTSNEEQLSFFVIPDRGPNDATVNRSLAGTSQNLRPFKLPNYQARVEKLILITETNNIFIDANPIFLTRKDGTTPISGRGNIPGFDELPVTYTDSVAFPNEDFVIDGVSYHALDYDEFGGDFEGILIDENRHFWMCDEYRPAIYHFDETGVLVERYVPEGTSMLGDTPREVGTYGAETLPAVYSKRRANRGFEAIALDTDENIVYAFIQTPLYNPNSSTRNNSDVIRILGINPADGTPVKEFVYLLERNAVSGVGISRTDKIGDAVYIGNGKFLVLERDSSTPDDGNSGRKYVFEIDTKGATNILGTDLANKTSSTGDDDKTLEMMSADDLADAGISVVTKTKVVNLPSVGYLPSDKPEGLGVLPNGDIVVMNDNDFGLAGAGVSDNSSLGILRFQNNYGFDASDRDEEIEIVPRPTFGMFQPDAIASYEVDGQFYFVTANEGDARDYDGFSEEGRVDDLLLDETEYPNAAALQESTDLGRLKTTFANGDTDGDGDVDKIYSYGARSFSIWDANGNLVFDSANDFEQITAELLPDFFNSQGDDNKKNRSDDKGPEPEALSVSEINGEMYAIVGLERIGGFMVYNISNPLKPEYVTYFFNRNFDLAPEDDIAGDIAPEDVIVVSANDSPTGETLIITSSEVSGTISFFTVGSSSNFSAAPVLTAKATTSFSEPTVFPNPVEDQLNIGFELPDASRVTVRSFDQNGRLIMVRDFAKLDAGRHNLNQYAGNWPQGVYFVRIQSNSFDQTMKVMKK